LVASVLTLAATVATCFLWSADVLSLNVGFVQRALESLPTSPDATPSPESLAAATDVVERVLQVHHLSPT
jgi:hypothetical protein